MTDPVRTELDSVGFCCGGVSESGMSDTPTYLTIVFNDEKVVDGRIAQCLLERVNG